jgi:hypothetical protein
LDLIRTGEEHTPAQDRRVIGLCTIADHRQMLREMIQLKLMAKGGIQPPRPPECVEVPFRGGAHPHAIRFKSIGVAKLLVKRTPIRLTLTKFGTPRDGFPIFQIILDEIKKQCLPLKAFHSCGPILSTYDEIFCFLHPSSLKHPKFGITHPSHSALNELRDRRIMENEKEIQFDGYYDSKGPKERLTYSGKLSQGLAWAEKDAGLSLQRQRDIKVMLGYLPKGNKELYAGRGDVDVPFPFRTSHQTSTDKWSYPIESNLEQASRASFLLGKRLEMNIGDIHNSGETEDNASVIDRFYYRVEGPALMVGEMKEALGLKSNRKKTPGLAAGWATLGMRSRPQEDPHTAAK